MQNHQIKSHKDCQFEITSKSLYSFCRLRIGFIISVVLFSDIWGIYFLITVFYLIFWHLKDKMREQSNQSHSACIEMHLTHENHWSKDDSVFCSPVLGAPRLDHHRDIQLKLCQIVSCIFFQSRLGKCLILLGEKERKFGHFHPRTHWTETNDF